MAVAGRPRGWERLGGTGGTRCDGRRRCRGRPWWARFSAVLRPRARALPAVAALRAMTPVKAVHTWPGAQCATCGAGESFTGTRRARVWEAAEPPREALRRSLLVSKREICAASFEDCLGNSITAVLDNDQVGSWLFARTRGLVVGVAGVFGEWPIWLLHGSTTVGVGVAADVLLVL